MTAGKVDNVKTAGRTLDLFEVFARKRGPLSLSELAQQIGSPVSSTHALVKTLRARGYVYVLDERKLIYPTKRIFAIAELISQNDPVIEIVLPVMNELQKTTNETIILGKRQGNSVVYLEVLESSHSIRYSARPGDAKPLHSSAIGKAMLSLLPDRELVSVLRKAGQKKVTEQTITDVEELVENIGEGRERNIFLTFGENVADVMAVSTTLTVGGEPVGLAIAGPMERLRDKRQHLSDLLIRATQDFRKLDRLTSFA